jgi:hypothetical protein
MKESDPWMYGLLLDAIHELGEHKLARKLGKRKPQPEKERPERAMNPARFVRTYAKRVAKRRIADIPGLAASFAMVFGNQREEIKARIVSELLAFQFEGDGAAERNAALGTFKLEALLLLKKHAEREMLATVEDAIVEVMGKRRGGPGEDGAKAQ